MELNGNDVEGSQTPGCQRESYCSRLINGKMVRTAVQPAACEGKEAVPLKCPPPRNR